MRKSIFIILLLAFGLFSLLTYPVAANEAITVEEATQIAKSTVTIPDDIKDFKSNYSEYNGRGTWQLNWITEVGNISVYIDALSGEITEFYKYSDIPESANKAYIIDKEKAITLADNFLAAAVPSKHNNLKILDKEKIAVNKYNQDYVINYYRIVNNIPCKQNSAYIAVSAQTGEITNYNLNWDYNLDFVPVTGIIDQAKAAQIIKNNAFELMYHKIMDKNEAKILLVYGIKQADNSLVNAHTGEHTNNIYYYAVNDKAMGGMGMAEAEEAVLNPLELEEIKTIKGLLTKEEAINVIKKHIDIPTNYIISQTNLYQDYQDKNKRTWSIEWQLKEEGKYGYISVQINAVSKEITAYHFFEDLPDRHLVTPNYQAEDALKLADDFINKIQTQKFKQVRLNEKKYQESIKASKIVPPIENPEQMLTLEYNRYINDIPFYADNINVTIDLITGKPTSYYCSWTETSFPNANNIIGQDKAFNKLTNENKVSLEYIQTLNPYNRSNADIKKVDLYYCFAQSEPKLVDAVTGKLLNYNGQEYQKQKPTTLTDIKNHPAEKDIKLLFDLGIITGENGEYQPNKGVTNAEFIKMLILASDYYPGEGRKIDSLDDKWYAPYYQTAVYRKIIDKDNLPEPEAKLSRVKASYMLLKAMNIGYIANLPDIYVVPTSDANTINPQDKGYISLATKLGLIKAKEGNFNPDDIMLKGETATTIVRYMRIDKDK